MRPALDRMPGLDRRQILKGGLTLGAGLVIGVRLPVAAEAKSAAASPRRPSSRSPLIPISKASIFSGSAGGTSTSRVADALNWPPFHPRLYFQ